MKRMKDKLIFFIRKVAISFARLLAEYNIIEPCIVCHIDGGICSQMLHYLYTISFIENNIPVYFDMTFYENRGTDGTGLHIRNFGLQQMYPNLTFKKSSKCRTFFFSKFLRLKSNNRVIPYTIKPPIYLCEYYEYPTSKFLLDFSKYFGINNTTYKSVLSHDKIICGVHIRRGDLADGDNIYYGGVTNNYFMDAINYVKSNYQDIVFRFYSDDISYVKSNIAQYAQPNRFEFVSDLGLNDWEELCELAYSNIIIASQGSFGKYATCMNHNKILLILNKNQFANQWIETGLNIVLI